MAPDQNLWFDLKLKKWYSHPSVKREDSRAFMDRQLASRLVVRGWLDPAYYTLGSDAGMSYMAAMGGWGVLDYGLDFRAAPVRLAAARLRVVPQLMGAREFGATGYELRLLVSRSGERRRGWVAVHVGQDRQCVDGFELSGRRHGAARSRGTTTAKSFSASAARFAPRPRLSRRIRSSAGSPYGGALTDQGATLSVNPARRTSPKARCGDSRHPPPFAEDISRLKIELDRDGFAADGNIAIDKR